MESNFNLSEYDCVGFDLDNTLMRYKIGPMVEMEYEILVNFLLRKGYSEKYLLKPIDYDFFMRGLVLDIEKGNILKLAADGLIVLASHGTKLLSKNEVLKHYPNSHWDMTDLLVKDPLRTLRPPNLEKIHLLLDYYESITALIFARLIDTVDEEADKPISKYTVYADIYEGLLEMFSKDTTQPNKGAYYKAINSKPDEYYFRCSQKVINLLKNLKKQGKFIYLLTSSYIESAFSTASYCLGPNWKDYFDIIIGNAKKPSFFYSNKKFRVVDGLKVIEQISAQQLELNGVYVNGNWKDLYEFISKHQSTKNPKCLYVGDHIIQDIYVPNIYLCCDTLAICEELAGNKHPYKKTINSKFWGSYFNDKHVDTFWYKLMKDNAKIWFSDMDTLADFKGHTNYVLPC